MLRSAAGDAIDYAYGEADIRWSYSAELRDTGTVSLTFGLLRRLLLLP